MNYPTRVFSKFLTVWKKTWTVDQKALLKKRLQDSLAKSQRANEFVDVVLKKCKEHGGPIMNVVELNEIISNYDAKNVKKFQRQEIQFQKATHKRDSQERPDLYKINNLTIHQLSENLAILLSDGDIHIGNDVIFTTEEEIMEILLHKSYSNTISSKPRYEIQQPLAVVWDNNKGRKWYVGFYMDENDNKTIRVDHLEKQSHDYSAWVKPKHDDIHDVKYFQIVPCEVIGEWDMTRQPAVFNIKNSQSINNMFEQHFFEDS
ncbi:unnamed protein product [Meganyctiphanes norvegica]|uniref:WYL domain-containing protein n=1 Tax=Meganyctiphanes norvegica TaxID=48144 RepID=A0AAV2QTF6_MEGNR